MRVALFGGSFNPPHVGHQLLALFVLETTDVDELWFVPAFQHPFHKTLEPFEDRRQMCERAAEALGPRVRVSDVEARLGGASLTLRTVRRLIEEHPGHSFSLVIGSDLVTETDAWHGIAELRRLVSFIVVERGGHGTGPPAAGPRPVAMPEISSSEIRAALGAGQPANQWLPRRVLGYIREHRLYGVAPTSRGDGDGQGSPDSD
jgi:nicotinate-nucleotide adenylyltransferase